MRPIRFCTAGLAFAALSALSLGGTGCTAAPEDVDRHIDTEVDALFARALILDGAINYSERIEPDCADDCRYRQSDFASITPRTGIGAGGMTISTNFPILRAHHTMVAASQAAQVIRWSGDLGRAFRAGRYGVLFYCQKPYGLAGSIAPLQRWFEHGLRVLQLAYSVNDEPNTRPENRLAGGCDEPDQGLTDLGRQAVAELDRLGIVIDVSHCSKKTTLEAVALSSHPITASHANAKALTDHRRNKDDDELRAIASTGGVIGVNTVGWMLDRDGDGKGSLEDFVAHLDHLIATVGIDHVGIASDAHLDGWPTGSRHYADARLAAFDRWRILTRELRRRGHPLDAIAKILGRNFVRVYDAVLPQPPR